MPLYLRAQANYVLAIAIALDFGFLEPFRPGEVREPMFWSLTFIRQVGKHRGERGGDFLQNPTSILHFGNGSGLVENAVNFAYI